MICNLDFKNIKIKVVGWRRSCRYHKKIGQIIERVIPNNFCLFAYHSLYPYALSMLYDGKSNNVKVYCPASKVLIEINSYPRKFKSLFNLAEKFFRFIGMPQDILDKEVRIKILKSSCPKGIKENDVFKFNIKSKIELCPASFNMLLPFMLNKSNSIVQCPADACRIRYKIIKN